MSEWITMHATALLVQQLTIAMFLAGAIVLLKAVM